MLPISAANLLVTFDLSTFDTGDLAQVAAAFAMLVLAILTLLYVLATRAMVREMRQAREAQSRPYVVMDLEYPHRNICEMVVKNIGAGPAIDVHVSFEPDEEYQDTGTKLSERPIFQQMRFFLPGREFRFFYKSLVGDNPSDQEGVVVAKVKYLDTAGKRYCEEIPLDPYLRWGLYLTPEKSFSDFVEAFEKLPRTFGDIKKSIESLGSYLANEMRAYPSWIERANRDTVEAKLLQIRTLWTDFYSKEPGWSHTYFQPIFRRLSMELLLLVSTARAHDDTLPDQFVVRACDIARRLFAIGTMRFYPGRGETLAEFNKAGDETVALIDGILK